VPDPIVCDLDGVIWLSDVPLPGSTDAVARLRAAGHPVAFVTNNSSAPIGAVEAKLAAQGIEAIGAVVGSAEVTATLLEPGDRALVAGGPGLVEALAARGVEAVVNDGTDRGSFDAVVVGFHREFDFERLRVAATTVRAGARLLASNDDATYPTPEGPIPGGGSILAAVERASGVTATVAGKPHRPMAELIRSRYGPSGLVVGDRPDTDGRLAAVMGWRFGLVLSGVTREEAGAEPVPDLVAPDLATLADLLGG
jgi:4-nitrophenyl phosphatase